MTAGVGVAATAVAPAYTTTPGPPRTWTLLIPAPAPMHSVNGNKHWRATYPARKAWREATYAHVRAARLPTGLTRIRVDVDLHFPRGARRDAPNYHTNVCKPIVDALGPPIDTIRRGKRVNAPGYLMVPDDTARYVDGPFPRIGCVCRGPGYGAVTLTITDLSPHGGGGA